jgi:hypothetical protein
VGGFSFSEGALFSEVRKRTASASSSELEWLFAAMPMSAAFASSSLLDIPVSFASSLILIFGTNMHPPFHILPMEQPAKMSVPSL